MKPMLAKPMGVVRLSECLIDPQWFVQQKLDGDRLLIHANDGAVSALNRNGELRRNSVPRKVLDQFRGLPGEWFFDGELLDEFWVFDMPVAGGVVSPDHSLEFRLDMLATTFQHLDPDRRWVRLLPTARVGSDKAKLVDSIVHQGAEGLVFKHRQGLYRSGCRTEQMLKFKLWNTADVVVSGVRLDGHNNCEYSLWDGEQWVVVGSCSLEGKPGVRIGDVVEVKYLYASEDSKLYQPSLMRVRDDKPAQQCTIDQLAFTNRSVAEFTPKRLMPYIRQQRHCRKTGVMVSIYDARHPDSVFDRDGGRWVTFCEDHGRLVNHDTLRLARSHAADSTGWCGVCAGTETMED